MKDVLFSLLYGFVILLFTWAVNGSPLNNAEVYLSLVVGGLSYRQLKHEINLNK